jgi:SNF2 family DNA or RNA helicase
MGLGKTVQVLALLHREKAERQAEALAALVAAEAAGGGEEGDGSPVGHGPPDPPLVGGVGGAEAEVTEAGVGLELAADAEEEVADATAEGAADAEGEAPLEGEGAADAGGVDAPEDPMAAEIAAALAAMSAEEAALFGREARATLLVCPASVLVNWWRETRRFAPGLVVHLHHGNKRLSRKALRRIAERVDLVLTTYGTVARDAGTLTPILWRRVVLDEAQHIKNPGTRQSRAIYHLNTARRLALTGTPVENRLGELWAISRFLNPGLLGSLSEFRRRFARPIERAKDVEQAARLKALCGPFMLRRLKKDPDIQLDLPEKLEIKEWCALTPEQVTLYQATLKTAFEAIEGTDGVKRKGNVLAALTRLKQICNHPALFLGDGSALEGRSGKLARLEELLTAVLAAGEKALIFTQYKGFGELLVPWLAERLGCGVLFLHGELEAWSRGRLVERFQSPEGPPIMLLSLRAGGVGLNLTAASHVIHMDRWWNPAVEDQASDRAYRIGQTREVQVRKLICAGTLEESIDAVIESKQALADQVLGVGEGALTELTTERLRAMLSLSAPGEERA